MAMQLNSKELAIFVTDPSKAENLIKSAPQGLDQIFQLRPPSIPGLRASSTMLQNACSRNDFKAISWLLKRGADPNLFSDIVEDVNSISPLNLCIISARAHPNQALKCIKLLIKNGAFLNKETCCSSASLQCSMSLSNDKRLWKIPIYLVKNGARCEKICKNLFCNPPKKLLKILHFEESKRNSEIESIFFAAFILKKKKLPFKIFNVFNNKKSIRAKKFRKSILKRKIVKMKKIEKINKKYCEIDLKLPLCAIRKIVEFALPIDGHLARKNLAEKIIINS